MGLYDQDPPEEPQGGESHSQDAAPAQASPEDYTPGGDTLVKTVRGHQVVPSNKNLPQIDSTGVEMTAEEAKAVVEEFPGYAYIATDDEKGGE